MNNDFSKIFDRQRIIFLVYKNFGQDSKNAWYLAAILIGPWIS